jgi:hypothetical protein
VPVCNRAGLPVALLALTELWRQSLLLPVVQPKGKLLQTPAHRNAMQKKVLGFLSILPFFFSNWILIVTNVASFAAHDIESWPLAMMFFGPGFCS